MPEGESSITLIILSLDYTARMIEFPPNGGTQSTLLGGTSGHRSFINDVDSIIHPNASTRVSHPPTNEDLVIATVGDDNTLIVWQHTEDVGVVPIAYSLSSRGVAVGFCKHFARRVMVAEEEGTIRVLDWLASDDARVHSSSGGGGTLWLLNIYMGVGLSMGVDGFMASAEWCGEDVDGEGGRIVGITKGGEWAVWDLGRIEGGGRTIPVERGQVVHASNAVAIRCDPWKDDSDYSGHPSESALFAIASKATHTTPALHIVDLTLERIPYLCRSDEIDQTNAHTIHSLPGHTISLTSASWHPTESVLAVTLSSGSLLITRIGERSDGEKIDRPQGAPSDLVISNGFHDEYDEYPEGEEDEEERPYDMSFEDSYTSRRGEEMFVDGED
jgi:hypothetical protein